MKAVNVAAAAAAAVVVVAFGTVNLFGAATAQTGAGAVALELGKAAQATACTPPAVPGAPAPIGPVVDRNAKTVISAGRAAGVSQFGIEVALGVILVESEGRNLASRRVPESLKYPNDGVVPGDHLSINLFQQQDGMGWFDTVAHGMDPAYASASFFRHLKAVAGWDLMAYGTAAQAVQRSAFPDRYAARQGEAQALYARLSGTAPVVAAVAACSPVVVPVSAPVVFGSWANPLAPAKYTVGSPFGPRSNIGWGAGLHKGQDLMVGAGTPVKAVCSGTVTGAGWDPWGGGNMITLNCGGGITADLMHNTSLVAKVGQVVKAGTVVALSGSTGHSTGDHVHVQVMLNGKAFDPIPWFISHGVPL